MYVRISGPKLRVQFLLLRRLKFNAACQMWLLINVLHKLHCQFTSAYCICIDISASFN